MTESERGLMLEIKQSAQELKAKIDILCKRGACCWCPLDTIEDCHNYNKIANMKYKDDMDIFV
jgi:hypothetical protein